MSDPVCLSCNNPTLTPLLNFSSVCSTVLYSMEADLRFSFFLNQCLTCSLVQQGAPLPPLRALRPRYEWQRFREPEEHLDDLVRLVGGKIATAARIVGLTWQDESLVQRFRERGWNASIYDWPPVLVEALQGGVFGVETVQGWVSGGDFNALGGDVAAMADLLVVRDVLEHAYKPREFLNQLRNLVSDEGSIVIEVPDARKMLSEGKHWLLWEQHILYFTRNSLESALWMSGWEPEWTQECCLDAGDYLVVKAKKIKNFCAHPRRASVTELMDCKLFVNSLPQRAKELMVYLGKRKEEGSSIFFYGANHISYWWQKVYGMAELISGVIDDDPRKLHAPFPGINCRIQNSDFLNSQAHAFCIHLFGPLTASKIDIKLSRFKENRGIFTSAESLGRTL